MRSQSFQIKNVLILLVSLLAILLIYSIDLYELSYKLKGWEKMGASPVAARQIQYLLADTPALVGFKDPESGEQVTCGTSIAYVKTAAGDPYRCCDTGEKIACLAGDFSTEIPVFDEACTGSLKEVFAIPDALENTGDYQVFGNCSGAIGVTVAQIDSSGHPLESRRDPQPGSAHLCSSLHRRAAAARSRHLDGRQDDAGKKE